MKAKDLLSACFLVFGALLVRRRSSTCCAAAQGVIDGAVLVGHNVGFDAVVLARARRARGLPRLRNPIVDTCRLAASLHP